MTVWEWNISQLSLIKMKHWHSTVVLYTWRKGVMKGFQWFQMGIVSSDVLLIIQKEQQRNTDRKEKTSVITWITILNCLKCILEKKDKEKRWRIRESVFESRQDIEKKRNLGRYEWCESSAESIQCQHWCLDIFHRKINSCLVVRGSWSKQNREMVFPLQRKSPLWVVQESGRRKSKWWKIRGRKDKNVLVWVF